MGYPIILIQQPSKGNINFQTKLCSNNEKFIKIITSSRHEGANDLTLTPGQENTRQPYEGERREKRGQLSKRENEGREEGK